MFHFCKPFAIQSNSITFIKLFTTSGMLLKKLKHERKTNHKLKQKLHTLVECRGACDPMDHHPLNESTFDGPQTVVVPQHANGDVIT